MNVVKNFAQHLNSFLLNGISALTLSKAEYNICKTKGISALSVQYIF
jgi:hypothetical protein